MRTLLLAAVAFGALGTRFAQAEAPLAEARRLVLEALRYREGLEILQNLTADPELATPDRVAAHALAGHAYAALGQDAAAEAAFEALLKLDPEYRLDPQTSPKIRASFDRARARARERPEIHDLRAQPEADEVRVSVRLRDEASKVDRLVLWTRAGEGRFVAQALRMEGEVHTGTVSLEDASRVRLDYYVEALDSAGAVLDRVGGPEAPSSLVVERKERWVAPPPPRPSPEEGSAWYGRWWVWTLVGVAVAGGVAATVVLTQGESDPPPGTLPPIRLD